MRSSRMRRRGLGYPVTDLWADEDNTVPRILVTGQGSTDIAADMAVITLIVDSPQRQYVSIRPTKRGV